MNILNSKKAWLMTALTLLAAAIVVFGMWAVMSEHPSLVSDEAGDEEQMEESEVDPYITITHNEHTFKALVADTPETRAQGLSGRPGLAQDELLLFVFDAPGRHGFWMRNMLFSIDIVWLDESGRVVHVEESVSPDTFPTTFTPSSNALYVIEGNAGLVEEYGLGEGAYVSIPLYGVGG